MAERLALPTSDHGVAGSNPAGGEILPEPKRRFIAQSLSCSPFHRLEMTEILLKGRKTLTHPSKFLFLKIANVKAMFEVKIGQYLCCPDLSTLGTCSLQEVAASWLRSHAANVHGTSSANYFPFSPTAICPF